MKRLIIKTEKIKIISKRVKVTKMMMIINHVIKIKIMKMMMKKKMTMNIEIKKIKKMMMIMMSRKISGRNMLKKLYRKKGHLKYLE